MHSLFPVVVVTRLEQVVNTCYVMIFFLMKKLGSWVFSNNKRVRNVGKWGRKFFPKNDSHSKNVARVRL